MKILHVIPSPRANISKVLEHQEKLSWDRFIPYFLKEVDAYNVSRDFFLSHPEYTHLAVGTDDIVVKQEHLDQLEKDLEENDYQVLTGTMNVYQDDISLLNITMKAVSPKWYNREYHWITADEIPNLTKENPIIQVKFSGFPLMVIRRDIVEQIPFYSDSMYNEVSYKDSGSLDVQFCFNALRLDVAMFADTRVFMTHLRTSGTMRVGTEKPYCTFNPVKGKKQVFDVEF